MPLDFHSGGSHFYEEEEEEDGWRWEGVNCTFVHHGKKVDAKDSFVQGW